MKHLAQFDFDERPKLADLAGAVFMAGFDDWPVVMVIQEVPAVDPDVVFEDKER